MKLKLGKRNLLKVARILPHGAYLDGGDIGDILLPKRYLQQDTKVGDTVDVFLYLDHEERLTATTQHPLIEVGQFAYLECTWKNEYGAFLNWGLQKDLFCPFKEQKTPMQVGKRYLVYCYIDDLTYRIVCTSRVDKLTKPSADEAPRSRTGETVGFSQMTGDRTILIDDFSPRLVQWLQQHEGFCPYHDHSPAEDIYREFGVSKKIFKQAVGGLYKQGIIEILDNGIQLISVD